MNSSTLKNEIILLGQKGLFGCIKEFYFWYKFIYNKQDLNSKEFYKTFYSLIREKIFIKNPEFKNEYLYNLPLKFSNYVEFIGPSSLKNSPIQFVRSQLLSFLKFHEVEEELIYDIIIGVVEATENAVKYSSDDKIFVKYFIEKNTFYIEIQNKYKIPEIRDDIAKGKYNSSITLMRGMLVMSKLFDEMNIDLIEERSIAIFQATKKLVKILNEKI